MERTRINERLSNDNEKNKLPPESEFGIKKTILVLAVVVGCFAILWPKIFYPMLIGPSIHASTDKSGKFLKSKLIINLTIKNIGIHKLINT